VRALVLFASSRRLDRHARRSLVGARYSDLGSGRITRNSLALVDESLGGALRFDARPALGISGRRANARCHPTLTLGGGRGLGVALGGGRNAFRLLGVCPAAHCFDLAPPLLVERRRRGLIALACDGDATRLFGSALLRVQRSKGGARTRLGVSLGLCHTLPVGHQCTALGVNAARQIGPTHLGAGLLDRGGRALTGSRFGRHCQPPRALSVQCEPRHGAHFAAQRLLDNEIVRNPLRPRDAHSELARHTVGGKLGGQRRVRSKERGANTTAGARLDASLALGVQCTTGHGALVDALRVSLGVGVELTRHSQ
jgi:hypothetical protein